MMMAGVGVQAFADQLGLERAVLTTQGAKDKLARGMSRLIEDKQPYG